MYKNPQPQMCDLLISSFYCFFFLYTKISFMIHDCSKTFNFATQLQLIDVKSRWKLISFQACKHKKKFNFTSRNFSFFFVCARVDIEINKNLFAFAFLWEYIHHIPISMNRDIRSGWWAFSLNVFALEKRSDRQ